MKKLMLWKKTRIFYKQEIEKDKIFLNKMEDSFEMEKFAREKNTTLKKRMRIYLSSNTKTA